MHLSRKHVGKYYRLVKDAELQSRPFVIKIVAIACKGSIILVVHPFINKYKKCAGFSGNCMHFKKWYCSKKERLHCMPVRVLKSYKKISKLEGVLRLGE